VGGFSYTTALKNLHQAVTVLQSRRSIKMMRFRITATPHLMSNVLALGEVGLLTVLSFLLLEACNYFCNTLILVNKVRYGSLKK
jgi:hypothetical protein